MRGLLKTSSRLVEALLDLPDFEDVAAVFLPPLFLLAVAVLRFWRSASSLSRRAFASRAACSFLHHAHSGFLRFSAAMVSCWISLAMRAFS